MCVITQRKQPGVGFWALHFLLNLVPGLAAIPALFLFWYTLSNWPLASLGLALRNPNEDDGIGPALFFTALVFIIFGALWCLVNVSLSITREVDWKFWILSSIYSVLPSSFMFLISVR